jgi:S-formylglutathione hydrolase FrmB
MCRKIPEHGQTAISESGNSMLNKFRRIFSGQPSEASSSAAADGADSGSECDSLVTSGSGRGAESPENILRGWSTLQLDGRRIEVFDPESSETILGVVLFLHGHGRVMLNENPVFTQLFRQHHLAAVCPDGGQSWWLDLISPDFSSEQTPQRWLLNRVIPVIQERYSVSHPQIALLGVSMGGQGVLQLAYRAASRFPVVAAISPVVDFYHLYGTGIPLDQMFPDRETARQASVVLNLNPLSWPRHQFFCCDPNDIEWFDGCARLGMKLSSSGILHERDLDTVHGGHSWDYFNHMAEKAIGHISAGLKKIANEVG